MNHIHNGNLTAVQSKPSSLTLDCRALILEIFETRIIAPTQYNFKKLAQWVCVTETYVHESSKPMVVGPRD